MPALPAVPNVIKYIIGWTVGADARAETILHFGYTGGPPSASDLDAIQATSVTSFFAHVSPLFCSSTILDYVTLIDLSAATAAQYTNTIGSAGTRSGTALPAEVSCMINYSVNRRYRGGHPRSYLPLGAEADLNAPQLWGTTFLDAVNTGWGDFITATKGASSGSTSLNNQVQVSYWEGYLPPTISPSGHARNHLKPRVGGPITDILSIPTANPRPASQRRRNLLHRGR